MRVLLLSGRYQLENTYRELAVKRALEKRGCDVVFALPSRNINANGYLNEVRDDQRFKQAGAIWIDSEADFRSALKGCDIFLFSTWKSYKPLVSIAHKFDIPCINFQSTSGLDHWISGVDMICARSAFMKRLILYYANTLSNFGNIKEHQIKITGGVIHENIDGNNLQSTLSGRSSFVRYYGLKPERPIVTLFPKGIESFRAKIPKWFPKWNKVQCDSYHQYLLGKYSAICNAVTKAGCNLVIKMHPTSYASYMCKSHEEYGYWSQYNRAVVIAPEHTYALYQHTDVGVGITSHSALDINYFGKPFIYVDSDKIDPPEAIQFHLSHLTALPTGPSSNWKSDDLKTVNPWFPSWVGYYSSADGLPDYLNEVKLNRFEQQDYNKFIEEFWFKKDGKSSERIADIVIESLNNKDGIVNISTNAKFSVLKDSLKNIKSSISKLYS